MGELKDFDRTRQNVKNEKKMQKEVKAFLFSK